VQKEGFMKIEVDQIKCDTTGICVSQCPEVFRFQEGSKKAAVILDEIPRGLHQRCREIASLCPTEAIVINE
jgi:ferredoxin